MTPQSLTASKERSVFSVDAYSKPRSIVEGAEDPTLDPYPIQSSAPPRDRLLPMGITLAFLASALILRLVLPDSLLHPRGPVPDRGSGGPLDSSRRVDIALFEEASSPESAPRIDASGGAGGGTGAIDPSVTTDITPHLLAPDEWKEISAPSAPVWSGDSTLPLKPGGEGLHAGSGEGQGGSGRAKAPAQRSRDDLGSAALGPDFRLVPVYKESVAYTLGGNEKSTTAAVRVAITVEEDGHVSKAIAKSGPEYLRPCAVAAALKYRFDPLSRHGLKAPIEAFITFHPEVI